MDLIMEGYEVTFMLIVYDCETRNLLAGRACQALFSFTVPASAFMSNEMILHAVTTASPLSNVTAAFVFHSGNVLINRIPRTCNG